MGFLSRMFGTRSGGIPLSQVTPKTLNIVSSDAGVAVTPETAMSASAVYACVNVIASALAAMPVSVVRTRDRKELRDHPAYQRLARDPNEFQTAVMFRETMMVNLLLWGNCYAFIERDATGEPTGLYPLRSSLTKPYRIGGGPLEYHTSINGQFFRFRPDQIFHVAYMAIDGIAGVAPILHARNTVGLSLATERFASKFFTNGGNLGGVLKMPPGMKDDAIKKFVASWKENFTGSENALKTAFLTDGMDYQQIGTSPEKSQMVETRVHQIREIARIYRVPLHKIGDLERATFSNIEHQAIEFMQDTIQPWAVKWEQEADRKLFTEFERGKLEIRFDLDSLLRADTAARYGAYNVALQGGWMTRNEVRGKENLPPIPGGDEALQPLNMGNPGGNPDATKKPADPPADAGENSNEQK